MQLNIPTRKSPKDIQFYLEQGPEFGSILKLLSVEISEGKLTNGAQINTRYKNACKILMFGRSGFFSFEKVVNDRGVPFGYACCVAVNDVVAHGRPSEEEFKPGDIVSVDCGLALRPTPTDGYSLHFDAGFTTTYKGSCEEWVLRPLEALKAIQLSNKTCLFPHTGYITGLIKENASPFNKNSSNIVVSLTGHGIGYSLHEAPHIHNMDCGRTDELFEGMCFCPEPIYSEPLLGGYTTDIEKIYMDNDGWMVRTISGRRTTHFETVFCCVSGKLVDPIGITDW